MTVRISPTTVIHIKTAPEWWRTDEHFVYIGRQNRGMHFGNPFSSKPRNIAEVQVESRQESVQAFRLWITGEDHQEIEPERREWVLRNLHTLQGKTLVCFCKQLDRFVSCHGDVLAKLADR